jgi:hypothetical protein
MAAYQHASDFIPDHPPFSGVIMGGKWVPVAADNEDWQAYLEWAAADPANVPDPWLPLSQGGIAIVLEEGQVAVGVMLDSLPEDQGGNPEPGLRPVNTAVPAVLVGEAVSGTANVGDVLSCTMGEWDNVPKLYSSVWMSDDGTQVTQIEAGTFYTVQPGDAGHSLTSVVTATNDFGATEAPPSNAVAVAAAAVAAASEVAPARSVPRHEPEPKAEEENHRRGRHRE